MSYIINTANFQAILASKKEILVFLVCACLIYSYNYHFLWIAYDVLAFYGVVLFVKNYTGLIERRIIIMVAPVITYGLLRVLTDDHVFKGMLSIWDTMKHVFVLPVVFSVFSMDQEKSIKELGIVSIDNIVKFLLASIFLQFLITILQFSDRVHWDDVAGSFGDGGTHPLGYLSLACAAIVLFSNWGWKVRVIVTLLVISINILAENMGFFLLFEYMIFGRMFFMPSKTLRSLFPYISLSVLVGAVLYVTPYGFILHDRNNSTTADIVFSRALNAITIPDRPIDVSSDPHNRSQFLNMAWHLGGLFGYGIGAFSNIYRMKGYDVAKIHDLEINISELTHLLAEWGLIGAFLVAGFYCFLFACYFVSWRGKLFAIIFFLGAFIYSSVLMTEPQIFFLGIALAVINRYERLNFNSIN